MATLVEYFDNDFLENSIDRKIEITLNTKPREAFTVIEKVRQHMQSSVKLFTYYIPIISDSLPVIIYLLQQIDKQKKFPNELHIIGGYVGDIHIGNINPLYSNRIYFYTETPLSNTESIELKKICEVKKLYVTIRSIDYMTKKNEIMKPLAFISHDSRDKELIARKLSAGLSKKLYSVWYDEYSLEIGQSLRCSIEKGIKEAKKCILILTKNYLTNPGWGKTEFNSIFTREIIMNEKVILPIWYGVTKQEVYEYSPSLADTFALTWPDPKNKTEDEHKLEVDELIEKIINAIRKQ